MNPLIKANNRILYNKSLYERWKELRKNMTKPEKKLRFDFLKNLDKRDDLVPPQLRGMPLGRGRFRVYKQRPIYLFIVDFYIPKLKIVIEVDGESHFDEAWKAYDAERTEILEWLWLKVLRFTNQEIMHNFDGVCRSLEEAFCL